MPLLFFNYVDQPLCVLNGMSKNIIVLFHVREIAAHLWTKQEIFRNFFCPVDDGLLRWQLVKACIDLCYFKLTGIKSNPFRRL